MTRGVRWVVVGCVVAALAGCGRYWFAEREPWRRNAEIACLQSGTVKEGPGVTMLSPIRGPGICGADYPLKVAALGDSPPLGYADAIRPPASIPDLLAASPPPASYPRAPSGTPEPSAPYGYPSERPDPGAPVPLSPSRDGYPAEPASGTYPAPTYGPPERGPLGPSDRYATPAGPAVVTPPATLACPVVSALERWMTEAVQPAARRWFGQPVAAIKQISAYSCRGMNGNPHANVSEHAFGNALDISGFVLADGRLVTFREGWRGAPEDQGFLRDVHAAACATFTTVLAPGSNAFHYDHIHVDLMRRASGRRICEPVAMSGEVAAQRARSRYGGRRDWVTGSTARLGYGADAIRRERPPAAVPGED